MTTQEKTTVSRENCRQDAGSTFRDPAELRLHPLQKLLGEPDKSSPEWHSFVDGMAAAGPEGMPAIFVTPEGFVMDGGRRWRGARQLQWDRIKCEERPAQEAAALIVESLFGQRNLTRGAKTFLACRFDSDYRLSVNARLVTWHQKGAKNCGKPLKLAKPSGANSVGAESGKELAARWGVSDQLVYQAQRILRAFDLPHKFEFQDGKEKTLREHFEPLLLHPIHPMGLGEVLKGIGWFVDENGKPKKQPAPPERNSHAHYICAGFSKLGRSFGSWSKMPAAQQKQCLAAVAESTTAWPDEMLGTISKAARKEARRRKKLTTHNPK